MRIFSLQDLLWSFLAWINKCPVQQTNTTMKPRMFMRTISLCSTDVGMTGGSEALTMSEIRQVVIIKAAR